MTIVYKLGAIAARHVVMLLSELIPRLIEALHAHGDLPVHVFSSDGELSELPADLALSADAGLSKALLIIDADTRKVLERPRLVVVT